MCGIFGYVGPKSNGAQIVFDGLKSLEYRGYDSWGVAEVPLHNSPSSPLILRGEIPPLRIRGGQEGLRTIVVKKKAGKIGSSTVYDLPPSSFALGHTRWATHGGVTDINAHPHLDCTKSIAIVHNGIFENYDEIKKALTKKNHKFISETDTEVIAHMIEEYFCGSNSTLPPLKKWRSNSPLNNPTLPPLNLRGGEEGLNVNHNKLDFPQAVRAAFNQMQGLNAIIAINHQTREFVAVRNGSPLVIGFGDHENFLASDAAALLPYTKNVHFMEDDEMAIVSNKNVKIVNVRTNKPVTFKPQKLNWSVAQVDLGKYPYFMLKEIHEQPKIIADIAQTTSTHVEKLAQTIKKSFGTYMVGCGSASYVCIAGSYLFSKIAKRHVNWAIGSEFGYHLDFLTSKSLVMALSQSGETMDTLESIKKARARGAKIFALVNVMGSTLYREADYKMLVGAGPEKSVASTKALTAKLSHLTLLAYALAGKIGEGKKVILQAAASTKQVLSEANIKRLQKLADKLKSARDIYVIGRGLSYPASLEAAIKIKETAYIHAEGMAAGELKHGPLALVEKGVPCIAFLPNDETYGANLAGAMEMKARGGFIIGISHKPHEIFDYYLPVTDAREATIIPNVVTAQALAYYITIYRGLDPDKPRNLAKSVTVK
ncbi:MAG: Glucosamine-fructose-6-phosphate aminotransferase, isomerizing [Candidatus Gottesmanbacteria bacterium GW2011_GWB1_43_11]|uniref:Glutamine--fructose-6-phosphate aminotransferase [isomerizing] n=1 Tax=Candidatus Gottesmanbacteria bacterium GW2011_GWB1_43_11 TaxID=1618446 RepID=A0A0G1EU00_9BACT|nr:MAG: Glucosamine-fructose-6-phosphate aminotransferase, isomerizing [Candidatus Gottesmanbacteria bacterium GW2011_GWA2_42_16]KKS54157.1 MAG: Glucosamine-fructose-6-phosphate aminotransferase, isomerizing [Candidatus Gottesmanbacteria bacterium GW2011_GWA1_42_26]KKS80730.1 MAG: Glucosamine-fructose-6-phosphate aminotransferase, isomerizing [Candidatus Gottesmanbacteria bacterium GW2011_GWC1_43_10]KKS86561.1 MAG: Glucosamine-fructose-6-phosphate aminotransferase, isomerizing [Candidatus Gottes